MKKATIGGQAVMEGVMMKSNSSLCIAVRTEKGIATSSRKLAEPKKAAKIPFIRGVVNFVDMMVMGVNCITRSAEMMGLEEEEPSKFEQWLSRVTGKSLEKIIMALAVVLAIAMSVG